MKKALLFLVFVFSLCASFAQSVGIGTSTPDASAQLDVSASNKGFLPPRMSTLQRDAIQNPAPGLQVYNITTDCLEIFSKGKWYAIFCAPASPAAPDSLRDIDGNSYGIVKICDQTWMQKNLNVSRYRNGDIIPQVSNPSDWASLTTGAWCWYNNDSATYGSVYGRLYNWYAVNDPRGLAPEGWHVSSDGEWNVLVKCLDTNADTSSIGGFQNTIAGGALKEAGTSHWLSPNTGANNSSGFTALPGGSRGNDGGFYYAAQNGKWWTSTKNDNENSRYRFLNYINIEILRASYQKFLGFSVRCVKDTPITTLNNGLVAYYPFSGNAGDSSGNGNHGTVNGATLTSDRFGNAGKAYSFDGLSNYVDLGSTPSLNSLQVNFTLSYWINKLSSENGMIIASYTSGFAGAGWRYHSGVRGDSLDSRFMRSDNINWSVNTAKGGSINQNVWQHICVVRNGEIFSTYINGLLNSTAVVPSVSINTPSMNSLAETKIGINWPAFPNYEYFNGKIDDIRIYNRALTQAEITYLASH